MMRQASGGVARALIAFALVSLAGCGEPSASPPVSAAVPEPSGSQPASASLAPSAAGVAAGRRADLELLLDRLVDIHPNPFLDEGEAGFRSRLDALAARAGELSEAGFLVGVMDLMGHRDRDGHSGAWAMAQTGERLHAWPIWLWDFPDGLRIVAATAPYADLVGSRVTAIGGTQIDEAWAAVAPLVPRDNPSNLRANLPLYLTIPEVLAERGVLRDGAPALRLAFDDGTTRDVDPAPLPIDDFREWIFGVYGGHYPVGLPPDPDGTAVQRHRAAVIWSEPLPDGGTYVGYNVIGRDRGPEGSTVSEMAREIRAIADATVPEPLIIDLRNNGGGDNTTFAALRAAIERVATVAPGSVALLAGRGTFSAAGNFVTDLETGPLGGAIVLVGEPPGGGPNIYGDVRAVTLPSSGIVVLISEDYHQRWRDHDDLEVPPDVAAEVGWDDLVAGRDPVLAAAIAATTDAR